MLASFLPVFCHADSALCICGYPRKVLRGIKYLFGDPEYSPQVPRISTKRTNSDNVFKRSAKMQM